MSTSARRHRRSAAGHFMKVARVTVSACMLALFTLLATGLAGRLAEAAGWIAGLQLMPLALAGAVSAVALWLVCAMLFGRIYCSSVCPMGTLQDCFIRLRRLGRNRHARRFRHTEPRNRLRYSFLIIVAACAVTGISLLPTLFDPYSACSRICSDLIHPAVTLAGGTRPFIASWIAFGIAAATLVAAAWFSFRHGRIICNTVCPVGATLGIFSRYSLFHFDIDTDLCVNCRKCEHACKAECISMADHVVDGSRCVACFNCVDVCDSNAIRYTTRRKRLALPMMQRVESAPAPMTAAPEKPRSHDTLGTPLRIDRRRFLATGLIVAAASATGALAGRRTSPPGTTSAPQRPVVPPGRRSMDSFLEKCTGCGLCVAYCPTRVLRPSAGELGWLHMLHPVMNYDHSCCAYNCTRCTEICPTGALEPLTPDEKHIFIIGHADVEATRCIGCGRCAAACPRKAITLIPSTAGHSRRKAHVDTTQCIGCGACRHACPVKPKAIGVNGII